MFDDLLSANAGYAESFDAGSLTAPPTRQLAVVTCMDARIEPLAVLGLGLGEAHVMRNAGGRVSDDVVRSLAVSTHVLGVSTVVVMHHTACGMAAVDEDGLRRLVGDATGEDCSDMEFLTIADPEEALRADVRRLLDSPLLSVDVAGFVYDVTDGRVRRVT
jgi:carbonic anhydrase